MLVDWCKVLTKASMVAGIDVIAIARKGLWGQIIPPRFLDCGYCYLVFPELINRNTKASWSVQ
jgi:hypothetical protein